MIKAVIDANVVVSAALAPGSNPDKVIGLVRQGKITLISSQEILEEIRAVFWYPKIRQRVKITANEIEELLGQMANLAVMTPGVGNLHVIQADPKDDKYLACALEGQADYIISGDKHLLSLTQHHTIKIVAPAAFLKLIMGLEE